MQRVAIIRTNVIVVTGPWLFSGAMSLGALRKDQVEFCRVLQPCTEQCEADQALMASESMLYCSHKRKVRGSDRGVLGQFRCASCLSAPPPPLVRSLARLRARSDLSCRLAGSPSTALARSEAMESLLSACAGPPACPIFLA